MGYLILYLITAIWVFFDARKRQNHVIVWPLASALGFGLIALPLYFAKRNLREGEIRKGGTAWNVLKNFAIFWTLTILAVALVGLIGLGAVVQQGANEYEQAGAAIAAGIGAAFGFGMIAALWFIVFAGALVLGFFLRKSRIVEKGPTGPLATQPHPDVRTPTTSQKIRQIGEQKSQSMEEYYQGGGAEKLFTNKIIVIFGALFLVGIMAGFLMSSFYAGF